MPAFNFIRNTSDVAGWRYDTLEGRKHIVAPMVMITEGVHNGNQGPVYYARSEMSKAPMTWNHKPVVVYHPAANAGGDGSACSPDELNTRKVGVILNTRYDQITSTVTEDGQLGRNPAEAWIDVERANGG